jgi:rfaE bifunctional protein kinase chain/domain
MISTSPIQLSRAEIDRIFQSFTGKRVLVIGDVMLDAYWWGRVERISPEAPVPIVNIDRKEYRLGGAANVALNLHHLGAKPVLCAAIGDDAEGDVFLRLLAEEGLSDHGIIRTKERPTTVKTRVIGNKSQLIRIDSEEDAVLDGDDSDNIAACIEKLVAKADLILFEDYDKGVISASLIEQVVASASRAGIPVAVDPKKRNFLSYRNVTLFKPNLRELAEGLKLDIDGKSTVEEISAAAHSLKAKLEINQALITLSDRGVFISGDNDHLVPAHVRNIYDVSGAGDTVISVAALALLAGVDASVLAGLANLAGGLVCEKLGVVPITYQELYDHALAEFAGSHPA